MTAYLDQPVRPLAEVLRNRIAAGDRVEHPTFGAGRATMLLIVAENGIGIAEAMVAFDSGETHLVALHHLKKSESFGGRA